MPARFDDLTHKADQMGNSALKKHYATAEKTGVLNISKSRLDEFPPELKQLAGVLRSLDLSSNKFNRLPLDIGTFTLLKNLNLDHNNLTQLPSEIGNLVKLEILTATFNKLNSLPSSLSQLLNLKKVELQRNELRTFPVMLCNLKHLDLLDLSCNKIESVPCEIGSLSVTELNLNQNQISSLAEEIADCPRLKTLRIQENCLRLSDVPPKILAHSNISTINAEGNLFDMKNFMELDGYDEYMERYTAVKKKLF